MGQNLCFVSRCCRSWLRAWLGSCCSAPTKASLTNRGHETQKLTYPFPNHQMSTLHFARKGVPGQKRQAPGSVDLLEENRRKLVPPTLLTSIPKYAILGTNMTRLKIELPIFHCCRCGYNWKARKLDVPVQCPKCRSPYWNIAPEGFEKKNLVREPSSTRS